jgi:ADP-ribosylglycohydrolase
MEMIDRYRGCLLGLAVGDALGTTLEFSSPGSFQPLTDMIGGGPFRLNPGEWTDDTSLALCLAESLVERREFDPIDQLDRYVRWYREGYLSSNGRCFDIGNTTSSALQTFDETRQPFSSQTDPQLAGNGSLMRLAPVPMFYAREPQDAIYYAGQSSRTTHAAPEAVDACRYYAVLICAALNGESRETLLRRFEPIQGYWQDHPLAPAVAEIASGSFRERQPPDIQAKGYVVKSLEAALWAFNQTDSFEAGCLLAVNLGDDSDTCGAIYGQLAGAFYGARGIPQRWLDRLAKREWIESFASRLYTLAWVENQ